MKKRDYYLLWGIFLAVLLFISIKLSEREEAKLIDLGFIFYCVEHALVNKNQEKEISDDTDIPVEFQAIGKYLNNSKSPFSDTKIPHRFINWVSEQNTRRLIRNGNLAQTEKICKQYHHLLWEFIHLCDSLDLPKDIRRKECYKRWKSLDQHKGEKGKIWSFFFQRRLNLRRAYKIYREQLELIFSTERVIQEQKNHFPDLYTRMNSLTNLDGSKLPIYVTSYPKLIARTGEQVSGLSIFGKYRGLFTSASPECKQRYPGLIRKKNALTVHLQLGVPGITLSHEFGHLYYLYYHWEDYLLYLRSSQRDYISGGHGPNDPSGQAAELAEQGILPRK